MPTKLSRSPYVLCHPGDTAGCGYHRVLRPLQILGGQGLVAGRADMQLMSEQNLAALAPDVVIWQRQNEDSQIDAMKRYRKVLPQAFFVYEIDDALSAVPDKSWHKPFMPSNVDYQTAKAIKECDVVTVTTDYLAQCIIDICQKHGQFTPVVRVVPNMLGADDMLKADAVRQQSPKAFSGKLRVGWGGGIGHIGDLAMLKPVFEALKDEVEWMFLGMNPEMPEGVKSTFAGIVSPEQYLPALAAMNLDLMIAPLERNFFNDCKSNLRMIEAGACSYAVIASDVPTYKTANPPVFAYATDTQSWIDGIRKFAALPLKDRAWNSERMRRWVDQNYVMDGDRAVTRLKGWIPDNMQPFVPSKALQKSFGKPILVYDGNPLPGMEGIGKVVRTLKEAHAAGGSSDILYIRNTVAPGIAMLKSVADYAYNHPQQMLSSVSVATNDGGFLGFPKQHSFMPVDITTGDALQKICSESYADQAFDMAGCGGPVILLKRAALAACGFPDMDAASPDLAIIEWSAVAAARGFKSLGWFGAYCRVDQTLLFPQEQAQRMGGRMQLRWPQQKTDDQGLALMREKLETRFYRETYTFLPPQNFSDYGIWADVLDTPGPATINAMHDWLKTQPNTIFTTIQYGATTFTGAAKIPDEAQWLVFYPEGAKLHDEFMGLITAAIKDHPDAAIFYGDHDYIDDKTGRRAGHAFKPNFDLHQFLNKDYVTQIMVMKREAWDNFLMWDTVERYSSYLYRNVLDVITNNGRLAVVHIPYILASLPLPKADDMAAESAQKSVIATRWCETSRWPLRVEPHPAGMGLMWSTYFTAEEPDLQALVSIIIPTKDRKEMLEPCINTILASTKHKNYEIVVVNNNTTREDHLAYLAEINRHPQIKVVHWPHDYNWSKLNNDAVREFCDPKSDFYVFLNDDTRVLTPTWLNEMIGAACCPHVGPVGAKLVYPHGLIQHIGVVCHSGLNGHIHKGVPATSIGYGGIAAISHEATAVTGACMLVSADVFLDVGGFDEALPHNFNDVAFCVEARKKGYISVLACRAELQHLEGATRVTAASDKGREILIEEGKSFATRYTDPDPYWNPNLQIVSVSEKVFVAGLNYEILNWVKTRRPWVNVAGRKRILHLGQQHHVLNERRDGVSVYDLSITGTTVKLMAPNMDNLRAFDIRDVAPFRRFLNDLGIDSIIVSSLGAAPLTTLPFLARMDLPITYRPIDAESVCPRLDFKVEGKPCDGGWNRPGACQTCVDRHGSSHGYVLQMAWIAEWARFYDAENVTLDFTSISPEFYEAVYGVYGEGSADESANAA